MVGSNLGYIHVMFIQRKRGRLNMKVDLQLERPVVSYIFVEWVGLVRPVVDGL